jgi:nucleoside-diphosphate-sugar epimerase
MAKILVTGGAGYLGSILVPKLLEAGHEVTVIDNFMHNQTPLLDVLNYKTIQVIRGDARDNKLIEKNISGKDFIIPLAALVGDPLCKSDPIAARTTNLEAIEMLIQMRSSDQKIIFPNTNSGYGYMEKGVSMCDEKSPLHPISLYGELKVEAEKKLLGAGNAVTLRLATVFGTSPRMRLDLLVNDFVYRAVNDGVLVLFESHFKRNYIHIRDVAKAFMHTMDSFDSMKDEPYNVGLSDANLDKKELAEEIRKQIPNLTIIESEIGSDPDKRNYIVSNEKIEKTGFRPDFSIQDGIKELIKGYQIIRTRRGFANF